MRRWILPLRSGGIIFLALLAEELIRAHDFMLCLESLPYMVGVALAFIAIEYARIYKVQLPSKKTGGYTPLVWA